MKRRSDREIVLSVRIPESLVTDIDAEALRMAEERGEKVSRSNAIRHLLRVAVKTRKETRS